MGIGGAFIMPSTLSILTNVFPAGERAKAIGIWAGVRRHRHRARPGRGGWLIEHADWSWVFLVNVPIVIVALVAGRFLVPESKDPAAPQLDLPGFALSAVGLTALVWAIIEAPRAAGPSPRSWPASAVSPRPRPPSSPWELRTPEPMLDVRLFANRRFSASSAAISLAFFALFGMIFFLTQYLQAILGYSALEAGVRTLPVAGGLILGGPLAAKLAAARGAKVVVAAGHDAGLRGPRAARPGRRGERLRPRRPVPGRPRLRHGNWRWRPRPTRSWARSRPPRPRVGSAVNDATRTAGGALGVAVLGSLLSSGYRGGMDDAVTGLPHGAADAAQDSLLGGMTVAARIGGAQGHQLATAAQDAFVAGMHTAAFAAAGVALVSAFVVLCWLPARAAEPVAEQRELVAA